MSHAAKTTIPGYKKDKRNNVVINTNVHQYEQYVRQIAKSKEFNAMKKELDALKSIVAQLVQEKANK